jgi:hypothetical protein
MRVALLAEDDFMGKFKLLHRRIAVGPCSTNVTHKLGVVRVLTMEAALNGERPIDTRGPNVAL